MSWKHIRDEMLQDLNHGHMQSIIIISIVSSLDEVLRNVIWRGGERHFASDMSP